MAEGKIPLILITGFLGSGKTSFLSEYLSQFAGNQRIAIIQNEFSQSNIDSEILKEKDQGFILRELDRGSIFCACLFSSFKDTLAELASTKRLDAVLIEATGIADPIAVAQLMEDERIGCSYYLQKIITLVDAVRFLDKLEKIVGIRHQIEVADYVLINKCDLAGQEEIDLCCNRVKEINPFAKIIRTDHGKFKTTDFISIYGKKPVSANKEGRLTRCGEGNYISRIYKSTDSVPMEKVHAFLDSLDEDILRLKGFVTDENGESYVVQYIPGQVEIIPYKNNISKTELISIGFAEPDFEILK